MFKKIIYNRRNFLSKAVIAFGAAELSMFVLSNTSFIDNNSKVVMKNNKNKNISLDPIKQINAGLLNVGYAEGGPSNGSPVILLHGWPYDIYTYAGVMQILVTKRYRVIVPFLRGYGPTSFLSNKTFRNGQQAALALDI